MRNLNLFQLCAVLTLLFAGTAMTQKAMAQPTPPPNDNSLNAIPVACNTAYLGTTIGATIDAVPDCGSTIDGHGVWYFLVGTGDCVTLSTCGPLTDFDTKLAVFDLSGASPSPCAAVSSTGCDTVDNPQAIADTIRN